MSINEQYPVGKSKPASRDEELHRRSEKGKGWRIGCGVLVLAVVVGALFIGLLKVVGKKDGKELRILKAEKLSTFVPSVGVFENEFRRNRDNGGGFFGGKPSSANLARTFVVTDAEAEKAWKEATAFAVTDGWISKPMYDDGRGDLHWRGEKIDTITTEYQTYEANRRTVWIAIQEYRLYDRVPEGKTEEEVTRGKKILYIDMDMDCCADAPRS